VRELTTYELDGELAEQLPARELMGACPHRSGNRASANANGGNGGNGGNATQVGLVNANVQANILDGGNNSNGVYGGNGGNGGNGGIALAG
jgi:hypothetical protein